MKSLMSIEMEVFFLKPKKVILRVICSKPFRLTSSGFTFLMEKRLAILYLIAARIRILRMHF